MRLFWQVFLYLHCYNDEACLQPLKNSFSLFTSHLENSTLFTHVKPSLENNSSNLLISIGVVIKITVYIYTQ